MDDLLKKTLGSEVVRYYPGLADLCGGATTALFLSQLLYWHYNPRMQEKLNSKGGWFYISIDDITEQTGLTRSEQITAKRNLIKLGILQISYKGMSPRTTHFRLDIEKLNQLVSQSSENLLTSQQKTCSLVSRKPADFNTDTTDITKILLAGNKKTLPADSSSNNHYPLVKAIVEVTGVDLALNRGKLFAMAKHLDKAGVTAEQVHTEYGEGGKWYRLDWRGQKGQKPTPEQVVAMWGTLEEQEITTGAINV